VTAYFDIYLFEETRLGCGTRLSFVAINVHVYPTVEKNPILFFTSTITDQIFIKMACRYKLTIIYQQLFCRICHQLFFGSILIYAICTLLWYTFHCSAL